MTTRGLAKLSFIILLPVGCIEPYQAPDVDENISIIVVDGFINATAGSATVKLTKTVPLNETKGYPAEKGAEVTIDSENGDSFVLVEQDSGQYTAYGLSVDPSTTYHLSIRTSDNRTFVSDHISVMQTPPIDSVTWRAEEEGVTILVNTHDDAETSRYYLWDYTETWEYHSPFALGYQYVNGTVILLKPEDRLHYCYRTVPSTKITVGSTVRLSDDVVRDFPLTYLQAGSSRLSVLYSMMVRQRVIDQVEYEYLQDLQRVTESVGGLFDSQPYEILGNIHATDPSSRVLGYFSAGFVDEKRMFVRFTDLPEYLQKIPYHYCPQDTVCALPPCSYIDLSGFPNNSYLVADLFPNFAGYTYTLPACGDCRVLGGVLAKPDFWP